MNTSQTCSTCGKTLPRDAPSGHCPQCLLAAFAGHAPSSARAPEGLLDPPGGTRRFGDYELLGEIASGGMGLVYYARQVSLNRHVALKMIASGRLATPGEVQRFKTEAEAAASLDHPHIVPIYEVGEHEGHHYFSMKLIGGGNLAERVPRTKDLARIRTPTAESAGDAKDRLAVEVRTAPGIRHSISVISKIARAVHHAHQRGILHRDIKPTNILLDDEGQPHLSDFGLAKLLQANSDVTRTIAILGTPHYMAPEQAAGAAKHVTTAADIYSLGAVLFELLAGRPVFEGQSALEILKKAQELDPPSLSRLNHAVDRDLETICLKCLEKEPARRYDTAEALADDLEHWLAGEPIQARPTGRSERLLKWGRRNPALALLIGAATLLLIGGIAGVVWQWRRAERAYIQTARTVTRLELQKAEDLLEAGKVSEGLAYLASVLRKQPANRAVVERILSVLARREIPLPVGQPLRHAATIEDARFSPDGRFVATISQDRTARLWDAQTGEPLGDWLRHPEAPSTVEFSRKTAALLTTGKSGPARVWQVHPDGTVGAPLELGSNVSIARWSPEDGKVLTVSPDGTLRVWNAHNGQPLTPVMSHPELIYCAEFSRTGDRVLTGSASHMVSIWDAASGQKIAEGDFRSSPRSLAVHPDGERFLVGCTDGHVRTGRVSDGALLKSSRVHTHQIHYLECSPEGRYVLTVSGDRSARLIDAQTGDPLSPSLRHDWILRFGAFSPDGAIAATVRLWEVPEGQARTDDFHDVWPARSVRFHPDGRRVVRATGPTAQMWDVRPGRLAPLRFTHQALVSALQFSPDGRRLAAATWERTAKVWDTRSGALVAGPLPHNELVWTATFSADGLRLATASKDQTARVWDAATGQPLSPPLPHPAFVEVARFTPDGRHLVTSARDWIVRVWEPDRSTQAVREIRLAWPGRWDLDPEGRRLIGIMSSNRAQVVDLRTGALISTFQHQDAVTDAVFGPKGDSAVSAAQGGGVWVWDPQTGEPRAGPCRHQNTVFAVDFDPTGGRFVTASADNTARIWNTATGALVTEPLRHEGNVIAARFSPDGLRIATASDDGTARLWDAETGEPLSDPFRYPGRIEDLEFSPDSRQIAIASGHEIELWEVPVVTTVPPWMPDFAEAVARLRRTGATQFEVVPAEDLLALRDRLGASTGMNAATHWTAWFLADRSMRARSPHSSASARINF